LLGSDFPFQPIAASEAGFRSLGISPAEQRAIGRTNALKLLPRFGKTRPALPVQRSGLGI
jgi:predicted TIM-barrel fold metal-dependent hydrolase